MRQHDGLEHRNVRRHADGRSRSPRHHHRGQGTLTATLNKTTSELTWKITYTGLTGPAAAGANAGVSLGFASAASPIEGKATLTAAQVADLMAGKWYANVHTAANKGGEIRGQVAAK